MYRITTTDGQTHNDRFDSADDAADAYAKLLGWTDHATSHEFSIGHDADGVERYAVCIYETQEQCDDDDEGAYAPRIVECGTIDW